MNKLNSLSTSVTVSAPASPEPASWLIVIVPVIEADFTPAIQRVWELAAAGSRRIRFLGLYENAAQELTLRRQLAGMSAMVNSAGIYSETEVLAGNNWSEVIRARWQAGDLIVCFAEQRVGPSKRSLTSLLEASLNVPIYILSGMYIQKAVRSNWWTELVSWGGFIAILAGFFLVQVRIHHLIAGWGRPVLILISVSLELWMVWIWNKLFS